MKTFSVFLNNHLYKFILVLILLLSALIYIYKIDLLSLNCDELFTINIVNLSSISEVIYEGNIRDTHPPLYHFLLFFFVKIFGNTEFGIRLFSSFCGILSIFFVFILAKKLFSVNEGIISSLIMIFSTYLLYVNQFARNYALFLLLSILTFIFFVNIIKNIDKKSVFNIDSFLYVFFSVLNIYTHYFALLLLANQLLFLFMFYRKKSIKFLLFFSAMIFLLYLPWIRFIEKKSVVTLDTNYLKWLNDCVFFNYKYKLLFVVFLISPILCILIEKIFQKKSLSSIVKNFRYELFLLFFCMVPYVLLFFINRYMFNCYSERYIVFLIPVYIILISRGITLLFRNFILQVSMVSFIVLTLSFNLFNYKVHSFTGFYCDDPRGAIKCISEIYKLNRDKDMEIMLVGVHFFDFYISKYLNNLSKDKITIIDWRKCNVDNDIVAFLKQKQPKYVLTVNSCHTNFLQTNYDIIFQEHFNQDFDAYLIKTDK